MSYSIVGEASTGSPKWCEPDPVWPLQLECSVSMAVTWWQVRPALLYSLLRSPLATIMSSEAKRRKPVWYTQYTSICCHCLFVYFCHILVLFSFLTWDLWLYDGYKYNVQFFVIFKVSIGVGTQSPVSAYFVYLIDYNQFLIMAILMLYSQHLSEMMLEFQTIWDGLAQVLKHHN